MSSLPAGQRGSLTARASRKAMSACVRNRTAEAVEGMLAATRFHPRAVAALSTRARYASAATALARLVEPDRVRLFETPALFFERMSDDVRLYRIATRFGLLTDKKPNGRTLTRLSLDEVRERARHDERARLVLAAYGEIEWGIASARERAAFGLQALIAAFRSRAS